VTKPANGTVAAQTETHLECVSTIMQLDLTNDKIAVGNRFMRRLYTIYDRDHDQVGLAQSSSINQLDQIHDLKVNEKIKAGAKK